MRIILSFLIGFFSFFFLSEAFKRIFNRQIPSLFGIVIIVLGFIVGFFGKKFIYPPLDLLSALFIIGAGAGFLLHHLLSRRYIISEELELKFYRKLETFIERVLEII